ncbi:glyoxylase-like metal-dependent hydrolase (beta-lactamase superfamily II) [Litoreibacter meonggei]|uniref:Glyoxylase-like metal-dependent hydrolase (Beta-lactamase superfamily II) n=1 Tax=Litoreibacter meonggei TaxID=1049199 RepID=A0A497VC82_9RHOB|nr:MBL fold metallo-hydrolase [Litoreibacter meonggei]RLJ41070.1 glyoxylase-like metal-dependent hydrolase (beta-lactamase superfamily II) [Litoreibacter meonggei]
MKLTRRAALSLGASLPLAAALPQSTAAKGDMKGMDIAKSRRVKLGGFEVTTLLAGTLALDDPQKIFGLNVSREEFANVSQDAFLPADKVQFFFTPTLIHTGSELILFDTGQNAQGITAAVEAAGYTTDQVDKVVITHMHGDHIGGLMGDNGETFKNASYTTGAVEHNYWSKADNKGFNSKVAPLSEKMTMIDDGASVASGITSVMAAGHTPGHMGYMIESNGAQLMLIADLANHPVWSLAKPDWEVRFDMDKAEAAASRRKVLGMLAADRVAMVGYHMPFPAMGYVATKDDGFEYVPMSYQMML